MVNENNNWWDKLKEKIHPVDFNNQENKEWTKERWNLIDKCKAQRDKEIAEIQEKRGLTSSRHNKELQEQQEKHEQFIKVLEEDKKLFGIRKNRHIEDLKKELQELQNQDLVLFLDFVRCSKVEHELESYKAKVREIIEKMQEQQRVDEDLDDVFINSVRLLKELELNKQSEAKR